MTTERNAQGVGVLAVMDRDAEHANRYRCTALTLDERQAFPLADVGRFAKESDAAYAAVAELVEAARAARAYSTIPATKPMTFSRMAKSTATTPDARASKQKPRNVSAPPSPTSKEARREH